MEKSGSYYDWELRFQKSKEQRKRKRVNSIGISTGDFGKFLREWKKKNFASKQ